MPAQFRDKIEINYQLTYCISKRNPVILSCSTLHCIQHHKLEGKCSEMCLLCAKMFTAGTCIQWDPRGGGGGGEGGVLSSILGNATGG